MGFNTAIAALMELVNTLYKKKTTAMAGEEWQYTIATLAQLLAPFAPHIAEEIWQQLGKKGFVHQSNWPEYDEKYLVEKTITIAVQVNGKLRGTIEVTPDTSENDALEAAKKDSNVASHLGGKTVSRAIYVPHKLINFVVK
jgi:leucyl-tRNA synthetase